GLTEQAVPAVLTGILPAQHGKPLPIYADHPRNVFTLLGHGYRVRAVESITQLCPERICHEVRRASPAAVSDATRSLTSDAGIVYLHLVLPEPYSERIPDISDRWYRTWPALQAYQRFLLQVEYTDGALGLIVRRLKEKGIYDRALMIVLADHGVSMRAGQPRRRPTPGNLQDIGFVPLFVKLPNQHTGRIDDGFAQTIDVVPTIAHVLGAKIPWHVDGHSLVGRKLPSDGTVDVRLGNGKDVTMQLSALRRLRATALREQIATFGS